ncbi:MAG: hypothetical protein R3F60_14830 [bacterium]
MEWLPLHGLISGTITRGGVTTTLGPESGISIAAEVQINFDGKPLKFSSPSAPAIWLGGAEARLVAAKKLMESIEYLEIAGYPRRVHPRSESRFWSALENKLAAVLLCYSAVEAWANLELQAKWVQPQPQGAELHHSSESLQRNLSLTDKLKGPLAERFGVESPFGGRVGQRFKALEVLRNNLQHLKREHWSVDWAGDGAVLVWESLLGPEAATCVDTVRSLIGWYYPDKAKQPAWSKPGAFDSLLHSPAATPARKTAKPKVRRRRKS